MTDDITGRVNLLVAKAGGQRPFGRLAKIPLGTVNGWVHGVEPMRGMLKQIAEHTGISFEWLQTGKGDATTEVAKISRLKELAEDDDSGRVREHPENRMIGYGEIAGGGGAGGDPALQPFSARTLAGMIDDIMACETIPAAERIKRTKPLQQALKKRLATEDS